jgi:hypothetical protein
VGGGFNPQFYQHGKKEQEDLYISLGTIHTRPKLRRVVKAELMVVHIDIKEFQ